jgi:cardiolipin synthase A/B
MPQVGLRVRPACCPAAALAASTARRFMEQRHSVFGLRAMLRALAIATAAGGLSCFAGCTALPSTEFLTTRYRQQAARFKTELGPVSEKKSAAIVAQLRRESGDLDILDRQITLEQQIGGPLVMGNKVVLLQDGPATYEAMFAAIRGARAHINVESFIVEDGEVGMKFADLLVERQAQGVQVNLIYDSVGAFGTKKAYFDRLKAAGVAVVEFNPIDPRAVKKAWKLNHRDHRKLMVVDGRTAFLGGINISSVYSSGSSFGRRTPDRASEPGGWRDTHIQIDGPVVADFQKLFLTTWNKQRGTPVGDRDYFPALEPQGKELVRAVGSTPDDSFSRIYLTLISAIMNAEKQVCITNAYFVPDPQLLEALLDAAGRGVDVRLILPSHSDSALTFHAGRSYYTQLLEGGVKIHERRGSTLHAKTAVIDGVWSCVGSSNLDWRSALDNDEINAVMVGREFATQMLNAYAGDRAESHSIDLETWKRRSLVLRMKEWGARLFGRLL